MNRTKQLKNKEKLAKNREVWEQKHIGDPCLRAPVFFVLNHIV